MIHFSQVRFRKNFSLFNLIWKKKLKFTINVSLSPAWLQILTQTTYTRAAQLYSCNNGYKNSKSYFSYNSSDNDAGNSTECSTSIDKSSWGKWNSFYSWDALLVNVSHMLKGHARGNWSLEFGERAAETLHTFLRCCCGECFYHSHCQSQSSFDFNYAMSSGAIRLTFRSINVAVNSQLDHQSTLSSINWLAAISESFDRRVNESLGKHQVYPFMKTGKESPAQSIHLCKHRFTATFPWIRRAILRIFHVSFDDFFLHLVAFSTTFGLLARLLQRHSTSHATGLSNLLCCDVFSSSSISDSQSFAKLVCRQIIDNSRVDSC